MVPGDDDPQLAKQLIGSILIQRKIIAPEQLDEALAVQKKDGGFLGEILVQLGYLDEKDILAALIVQCSLPYIAITKYDLAPELAQAIPEDFARKNFVIPLDRVGDVLSVVMVNPLSTAMKKELERVTGCRIATFIATKSEIKEAIDRLYQPKRA